MRVYNCTRAPSTEYRPERKNQVIEDHPVPPPSRASGRRTEAPSPCPPSTCFLFLSSRSEIASIHYAVHVVTLSHFPLFFIPSTLYYPVTEGKKKDPLPVPPHVPSSVAFNVQR